MSLIAPALRPAALVAAALILTQGPAAHASDDSALKRAFGSTIVSTHPDGRKAKLWLNRDGGYSAEGRAGQRSGGTWKVKDGKLCLTQHRPIPIPFPYCKPIPPVTLGKPWRDVAVNGEPVTNEIVRGTDPAS